MAYEIIGTVFRIGATENVQTKNGQPFQRRSITLIQKRFDQNTGQEFEPNYPTIDFTQRGCAELDKYKQGDRVRIRFDVSGVKYNDKQTREEKFFNSLRGFRIEPFVMQQPQQPAQPSGYEQIMSELLGLKQAVQTGNMMQAQQPAQIMTADDIIANIIAPKPKKED